jgi:hypothetical protein
MCWLWGFYLGELKSSGLLDLKSLLPVYDPDNAILLELFHSQLINVFQNFPQPSTRMS